MNKPSPTQEALASDLRDLGLAAIGGRVLEGRISIERALEHVERERRARQRMLVRKPIAEQLVEARAKARDEWSVAQILDGLAADELGAVA